jgi:hypothetical protein
LARRRHRVQVIRPASHDKTATIYSTAMHIIATLIFFAQFQNTKINFLQNVMFISIVFIL